MPGIAGGVGDHIGNHRSDQFPIEETQRIFAVDAPGGENIVVLKHLLMSSQLRFDEVVQLVIVRAHRQLVDAQFVQPQHLHQHAI
ncbi:hypothetical protein PpSQ1_21520 [Pseudomonas putida]|nr:hypothetical protein PpSQ1_21520 [Pseudomonas putida]